MADWEAVRRATLDNYRSNEDWTAIMSEYGSIRLCRDREEALKDARRADSVFRVRLSEWVEIKS